MRTACKRPEPEDRASVIVRATALEAYIALLHEGPGAEAVRSYLAPGAEPRYDTPDAQAEAELEAGQ